MQKDIERLSKKAAPPEKLPVPPSPQIIEKTQEKAREEMEKRKKVEEKAREKAEKLTRKEEERLKALRKKERKGPSRLIVIGLAIILILGGIGGFLYWWNYIHVIISTPLPIHLECQNAQCLGVEGEGENQCSTDADCLPPEPTLPSSLIPVDETETIELAIDQTDQLLEKLKIAATKKQEIGTLKRILIKLTNGEEKYTSLTEFVSALNLIFPEDILNSSENYTLFFYAQAEGQRLGLVINTTNNIKENLILWEKTMVTDLASLFLDLTREEPATQEFQDNIYQDIAIRYLNFPNPDLTIDYALFNDKLVITTSKASMYAAIDALLTPQ
jgi:hypothetical protein